MQTAETGAVRHHLVFGLPDNGIVSSNTLIMIKV